MKNIIFIVSILIFSCDYPIIDSQKAVEPKVAISSFFCPDSVIEVKVTPVSNAFSDAAANLEVKEVKLTNLKNAQVAYLENEGESESIFSTDQFIPSVGDVLKIDVEFFGYNQVITAIDTIPDQQLDIKLETNGVISCPPYGARDQDKLKPSTSFRFLPNQDKSTSYYEFFVDVIIYGNLYTTWGHPYYRRLNLETTSEIITSEDYYPSNPVIDELGPESLLFRCVNNKDSLTIDFSYFTVHSSSKDIFYTNTMDMTIELREVSYAYYKYKTSLYKQNYAIDGNYIYGVPAPVTVFSNVENGTGIFGAYSSVRKTFRLESKAYPM